MKRYIALIICVISALTSCSCSGKSDVGCFDVLCELLVFSKAGVGSDECLYSSTAEEGEVGYFPEDLKNTFFGEKRAEECFSLIEECAMFVSAREIEELAVFRCYSRSDTDSVAAMCLERADMLKVALNSVGIKDTSQKAHVEIHGKYVLYSFMDRSEAISEYFIGLI